jgi:hypothetical protein
MLTVFPFMGASMKAGKRAPVIQAPTAQPPGTKAGAGIAGSPVGDASAGAHYELGFAPDKRDR